VLREPLVANVPLQAPEAVQEVALVALHVKVVDAPDETEVSAALIDTVGPELPPEPPPQPVRIVKPQRTGTMDVRINPRVFFGWRRSAIC
jgi:hypothetical protein